MSHRSNRNRAFGVVTGATSGIGAEFARRLAADGLSLIVTGRRQQLLDDLARELEARHQIEVRQVVGDFRQRETFRALESACSGVEIDALVNSAGYSSGGEFSDLPVEEAMDLFGVLAGLPLKTMGLVLSQMKARRTGLIINVGSLAGRLAVPRASIYVASKAFIERISETVALEVASSGVVVQALLPGYVRTDFHREVFNYQVKQRSNGFIRWTTSAKVVAHSLRAASRARRRVRVGRLPLPRDIVVVPGVINRILVALSRITPRRLIHLAAAKQRPI